MATVFISYRREKSAQVDALVEDIGGLGHDVWIDRHHEGNEQWWKTILAAIAERDAFIPVYDINYDNSYPCCRELDYAVALQRQIIPVVLDAGLPEDFIPRHSHKFNYVHFSDNKSLIISLQKRLSRVVESPPDNGSEISTPGFPAPVLSDVFNRHILTRPKQNESDQILSLDRIEGLISENYPVSEIEFLLTEHKLRGPQGRYRYVRPDRKYTDIKEQLNSISGENNNAIFISKTTLRETDSVANSPETGSRTNSTSTVNQRNNSQTQVNSGTSKSRKTNYLTIIGGIAIVALVVGIVTPKFIDDTPEVSKFKDQPEELKEQEKTYPNISSRAVHPDVLPGLKMIPIPAGTLFMGSSENEVGRRSSEGPPHEVSIQAFELSDTEVTFEQYDLFASETKRKLPNDGGWGRGERPVINVSWNDAFAYIAWLNEKTASKFRLPNEAEWEYAARVGTTTTFYTGNCISTEQANYKGTGEDYNNCGANTGEYLGKTSVVRTYEANDWDLYDMFGNVSEWTQDCWYGDYRNAPVDGSAWLEGNGANCNLRVARGGSWKDGPEFLRSAARNSNFRHLAFNNVGFRLARTVSLSDR